MNASVNKAILMGNLGDDVKIHYFENGDCIGRFPIATSEYYIKKESGERIEQTEWHNIVVRNKWAENCERFLRKGDKVYVEGRIKTRKWESDSETRYTTEIHGDVIQFLTKRSPSQPVPSDKDNLNIKQEKEEENDLPF